MALSLGVHAITLFVEDLAVAREFYQRAFDLPVHFEDPESCAFLFGATVVNLLVTSAAPELIAPLSPGPSGTGPRAQLTINVDDVDRFVAALVARGVTLLNGPIDRPWGVRTAAFTDPDGHVWEIAC